LSHFWWSFLSWQLWVYTSPPALESRHRAKLSANLIQYNDSACGAAVATAGVAVSTNATATIDLAIRRSVVVNGDNGVLQGSRSRFGHSGARDQHAGTGK